ncbi:MAG: radical SAM protein [Nitrospina sp.]|nr:radical SAM protein [Nitrospina sp.]
MDVKNITSLIIEPTNTCNLRCTFCFVTDGMTRDGGFMDFNIFKKIIDDCTDLEHLCMHNWGEPLLHKDIFRMIEYAKNKGVNYVVMNTNGTLLTDKMINRIVNSKLDIIRFSIDGSAETFKRVRGVELENIEKNIKKLKIIKEKKRPELKMGVVFTVEEDTEGDAEEYIKHWEKIVDHVRLQPKLITSPRTEVCPEPFGKDYGKLVVLWDGRVIPCCVDYNANLMIGNIQNDTIPNLWKSEKLNILREQHLKGEFPDTCANCNECESNKADKRFFVNALTK